MTDKDTKEKMADAFLNYTVEVIKSVFVILDSLLSQCNSLEDFKVVVKQTANNLKTGEYYDKRTSNRIDKKTNKRNTTPKKSL